MNRALVSRLELWCLEGPFLVLPLALLLRGGWNFWKFHDWPLADLQMLFPSVLLGALLLANWSLPGITGQAVGGLLGLGAWFMALLMLPGISWPLADLPQWIVWAGLGFFLLALVVVSLSRAASRLRLRLHGRDWILRHLPRESFYRRLDAHRHLNGLGLIAG